MEFKDRLNQTYARLRDGLARNPRGYEWRRKQLLALKRMLDENDKAINRAMWLDLHKSPFECQASEQGVVLSELADTLRNLKSWMKPQRVSTPLYNQIGRSQIVHEPYGLVLIIGAWNYPINLTLAPFVGAIAGGNCAIIKPSEISAHTSALIAELVPKYMDPDAFAVIEGGVTETDLLLDQVFDLIFFTGSGPVGKIILAKAAPHLTPVVLELGGKSPAVVLKDADIEVSARRIAWGKFMNAGQTCVAPDYVLITSELRERFVVEMKKCIRQFYGDYVKGNESYCRIVNAKNFDRLKNFLQGVEVLHGGEADRDQLYIEPTIIAGKPDQAVMKEEIFGPILPILTIDTPEEAISFINARPKPLSLYVFTKDNVAVQQFTDYTSSGALCVNDVVIHMPQPDLPFGGVGASGMGNYHGRFSFETFTHAKGVLRKATWFDVPVRYAPYTDFKAKVLRWLFS